MNEYEQDEMYFEQLPLLAESNRVAQFYRSEYKDALEKDITDKFYSELEIRASSNLNLILSWFGGQGTGKSYSMLDIAQTMADFKKIELDVVNVAFTITEMLKIISNTKIGDIGMLDEQIHTSGMGSTVERNALSNIEMTVRAHKLSLFFSAPIHIYHAYHYYIETWEFGNTKPIDWSKPVIEQWKFTKCIVFDTKDHPLGYIITTTPKNKQFLETYEKNKSIFIQDVKGMRTTRRHETLMGTVHTLASNDEFLEQYTRLMSSKKPKRLRRLLVLIALKGQLFASEEINTLVDYLEYIIEFEPEIIEKVNQMKTKSKIEMPRLI